MNQVNNVNTIESGHCRLFNDFEIDGPMWIGKGEREVRERISFKSSFFTIPVVSASTSLMDAASDKPQRYAILIENLTKEGFDLVFRTWMDSRFARVWINWTAFGEKHGPEYWHDV